MGEEHGRHAGDPEVSPTGQTEATGSEARGAHAPSAKSPADENTLLVLVVDRSGSMVSIKEDMEGGIKHLLAEQAEAEGHCSVTLAQFDNEYELFAEGVPIDEFQAFELCPRGGTALLDAIGRTIELVKSKLGRLSEDDQPDHVIFAVVTDGLENSSRLWSRFQVQDSVRARMAEGWEFTFLGADQDAIKEGGDLGFDPAASMSFGSTKDATDGAWKAASRAIYSMRTGLARKVEYQFDERIMAMPDDQLEAIVRDETKQGGHERHLAANELLRRQASGQ